MSSTRLPHDSWAKIYDEVYVRSFGNFYEDLTRVTLEVITQWVPHGGTIVDFGAGTGRLSIPLAKKGYSVMAVEPSTEMIKQLQEKQGRLPIQTVSSKMEDFSAHKSYDMALCVFTVILYLLDENALKKSFQSAYDSLKNEGYLLLDIPAQYLFQSSGYSDEFMEREVKIDHISDRIYNYQEKVLFKTVDDNYCYQDNFKIRYWDEEIVLDLLESIGFIIEQNLSGYFMGSGSLYYLLKKQC